MQCKYNDCIPRSMSSYEGFQRKVSWSVIIFYGVGDKRADELPDGQTDGSESLDSKEKGKEKEWYQEAN